MRNVRVGKEFRREAEVQAEESQLDGYFVGAQQSARLLRIGASHEGDGLHVGVVRCRR